MNSSSMQFKIEATEPAEFSSHRISRIKHNLNLHPLLQLDALKNLAKTLEEKEKCRFAKGDMELDSEFSHQSMDATGRSLDEVFDAMETPGSWIALYNVELHQEYRDFLVALMEEVKPLIEPEQSKVLEVQGFIFISSPPSVTPYHIDRENNFWLQISGKKLLSLFDHSDRDILSEKVIEDFITNRNLDEVVLNDEIAAKAQIFACAPGDGVYFPCTTPHMTQTNTEWVEPGNGVSISIGVVFYTDETRYQARIHQCNRFLRKIGIEPSPPGTSRWKDAIKAGCGRLLTSFRVRFRSYNAPPWSY